MKKYGITVMNELEKKCTRGCSRPHAGALRSINRF